MIKLDIINEVVNRTGITKTKAEMAISVKQFGAKVRGEDMRRVIGFVMQGPFALQGYKPW